MITLLAIDWAVVGIKEPANLMQIPRLCQFDYLEDVNEALRKKESPARIPGTQPKLTAMRKLYEESLFPFDDTNLHSPAPLTIPLLYDLWFLVSIL